MTVMMSEFTSHTKKKSDITNDSTDERIYIVTFEAVRPCVAERETADFCRACNTDTPLSGSAFLIFAVACCQKRVKCRDQVA